MIEPALHVVFGAGPLGQTVARQVLGDGGRVRLVSRSGRVALPPAPGLAAMAADAADPAATRAACAGAAVVHHCIGLPYDQWAAACAPNMRGLIEGAASAGATLVYGDNVYAYGAVTGPIHEALPETAHTVKGRVRAEVAAMLRDAHRAGRLSAVIVRGSDFFGPGVTDASMLGSRVFGRLLAGKPAQVVGNPDLPHSYTYLPDFARAMVLAASRDDAAGRTWHVPNAPPLTTRQIVRQIAAILGVAARVSPLPGAMVSLLGLFNAQLRELKEMLYEFDAPFVVDSTAFERAFGVTATPFETSLAATVAWYRERRAG
ncbi:MAG: NAD-dependent epimerase/dehydratase family protein [Burkholderiales bacterium]